MRTHGRIVLAALALATAPCALAQSINDTYDRISKERTISYSADGTRDSSHPALSFNAYFAGGAVETAISLAYASATDGPGGSRPRFAGCHGIEWFVDGQPLPRASSSHRHDVIDGELIELIDQEVGTAWVAAVGNAGAVRYRVCREEYAFTAADIRAFATIGAKLRNEALSSSVPAAGAPAAAARPEVEYKGMDWRPKHPGSLFPARN